MEHVHEAYNTDVCKDDGCRCSSDEALVMSVEQRTADIQFQLIKQLKQLRMKDLFETKSKPISDNQRHGTESLSQGQG